MTCDFRYYTLISQNWQELLVVTFLVTTTSSDDVLQTLAIPRLQVGSDGSKTSRIIKR
jgi:hypothetical protein